MSDRYDRRTMVGGALAAGLMAMSAGEARATGQSLRARVQAVIDAHLAARRKPEGITCISAHVSRSADDPGISLVTGTTDRSGHEPITTRTLFEVGSNTKAFTSALLVVLAGLPTSAPASASAVQQVPLAPLKARADAQSVPAASRQPRPGSLNQQVMPASNRAKFRAEPARTGEDVYIVRLRDLPVATYDGRTRGYAATARAANAPAGAAAAYRAYLANRQQGALRAVRAKGIAAPVRHQFTEAFNGFTLKLTQKQAATVASLPQVAFVQRSELQQIQTDRGPAFVRADSVWAGASAAGLPYKGEGQSPAFGQ